MEAFQLTATDRQILEQLSKDGRIPLTEVAHRLGIPTSTCHSRVRALEANGVIRGYSIELDPAAAGLNVHAMIQLPVLTRYRKQIPDIAQALRRIPGVQRVFLIGGDRDLILHVACRSVPELRNLIAEHIGSHPALARSETQLVFEHHSGLNPLGSAEFHDQD